MTRERFIKLMMLTTSPNDNEALSAIRMINTHLKAEGKDWDDIFNFFFKLCDIYERDKSRRRR